jgi:hypothetical protein
VYNLHIMLQTPYFPILHYSLALTVNLFTDSYVYRFRNVSDVFYPNRHSPLSIRCPKSPKRDFSCCSYELRNSVLLAVYLTTLSVAQSVQRRIIEWLINSKLGQIWKQVVVAKYKVQSRHVRRGTEDNHENWIAGLRAETRTRDLLNTKHSTGFIMSCFHRLLKLNVEL